MPSLSHLLQRLADSGVDFVVIGGYAGVLHGSSYVTRDVDVCAVLTSENIEKLRETLRDLDPRHRRTAQQLSFLQVPKPGETLKNIYLRTDWGVVDILSSVEGLGDYHRLSSKAEWIELGGKKIRLIALDDLIVAKEALAREKDLLAAKELRAIAEKKRAGG
jgi:predicted nucleotidyltransferase